MDWGKKMSQKFIYKNSEFIGKIRQIDVIIAEMRYKLGNRSAPICESVLVFASSYLG
jgi:hypothetical protein